VVRRSTGLVSRTLWHTPSSKGCFARVEGEDEICLNCAYVLLGKCLVALKAGIWQLHSTLLL
jgi:hypothetical protein